MIGQTISHYQIVEKLGEGGMGVVYRADDTKLRRAVALKFLAPDKTRDEEAKKRFIHEAQAASALDHPNIAVVHEIDETDDGRSFICMAYYPGPTLKERIEAGPLPLPQAVDVVLQIANGLQRAHEAGIVHRDIKPANIILTDHNEVKIVDFGIAKLAGATRATRSGPTAGTAAYMSPEQAQGMDTDHRSDLFSLGIVFYEMVTGKRPFQGEHDSALLYTIVSVDPVPPSTIRQEVSPELEMIILRLLEKDPSKRYQSAAEVRSALMQSIGLGERTRQLATRFQFLAIRNLLPPLLIAMIALLLFVTPIRDTIDRILGTGTSSVPKHLVVLPFINIGGDSTKQAFCDGLTETLTAILSQLRSPRESLWVTASSEVRQGKITTADQARRSFGATLAVSGSVQLDGHEIRIILNLVDTKTLRQLDSKLINDRVETLAALQDKTVQALVAMLNISLETASVQFASAGKTNVSDAYNFYIQGRGYLSNYQKMGNIDLAIQLFERALQEDSTYALAYAGLGDAYWRKYDATRDLQWVDRATRYCKRGAELDNKSAEVHLTLAIIYTGTGKYHEAVSEYQEVLRQDTASADAYRGLARTLNMQGNYDQSERAYKKAVSLQPSNWAGHSDLGSFYYARGRYAEALDQFKRVADLTPDNPIGFSAMGAAYNALQRPAEAEEAFKRSIIIEPTYRAYNNLATLYFRQGRLSDVAAAYERALALNDHDYRVWANLASAYYWSGQQENAKERFERAIQMAEAQRTVNPRDPTVLSQLADYYSMIGKKPDARILIKQALLFGPGDLEVIKRAVDIYETIGQREQALALIEQGLKKGILPKEFGAKLALKTLQSDKRYQQLIDRYGKKP